MSYTFSQVAGDHTIEVTFEKIPQEDKADLSGLQEAVRKAEETDLTGYTDEQLADLNKLLDQAGEMLQNQNLTAADQPGIDQLTKDLLAALSSLPQKPGEENPGQTGVNRERKIRDRPEEKAETTARAEPPQAPASQREPGRRGQETKIISSFIL